MAEFQSCYFCGTIEGLTELAVVPPRHLAGEEDPPTVVLCESCAQKTRTLLEPLAEQLDERGANVPEPTPSESRAGEDDDNTDADDEGVTLTGEVPSAGDGDDERDGGDDESAVSPDEGDDAEAETASDEAAEGDDETDRIGEEPEEFRRVMRFLANRTFPLTRGEVTDAAAAAYDLPHDEVDACIDHALERGVLVADGDELRKA